MRNNRSYKQETAGVIRYSCGILFMLFAFCYLYFIQGDVLAQAQFVFSHGITHYSIPVGAGIITVVLLIVQWVVARLSQLPPKMYALSYVPSALMLAVLSDFDEQLMLNFTFGKWLWIAPAVLLAYIVCAVVGRMFMRDNDSFDYDIKRQLYPNFIILLALILGIGSVPRTTDVYHYELLVERLIQEGKYEEATEVGKRSFPTSERLTRLRMYALSRQGRLADDLFTYPQHYGARGLLDIADTADIRRISANDITLHLGAFCGKSIKSTKRYLDIMLADSIWNQHTADYYLCSLLLDKHLQQFRDSLPRYYNISDTVPSAYDALPRAYREALLFMADRDKALQGDLFFSGDSVSTLTDTTLVSRFRQYEALKQEYPNLRERINKTHRKFGDTFWWYYEFSDKAEGQLSNKQ